MFLDIKLGNFKEKFHLVKTEAPVDYDYGYTIEAQKNDFEKYRYVLIPENLVDYQTSRYASGLYKTDIQEDSDEYNYIQTLLYHRLRGEPIV